MGTYPYKTTKKKTVCLVWGIAATGLEWVSLAEGTSYGYWRYTEVHRVCLASLEVDVEVIECLPLSVLTKA